MNLCFKTTRKCKLYFITIRKMFFSLGCGIGYGYLHRIPTRPFEEGKKISLPGQVTGTPVTPLKDGFTEVRSFSMRLLCGSMWWWHWLRQAVMRRHSASC